MGLPGSRFALYHRLVFLLPFALLTLTCFYTSSTLLPFGTTYQLSFSEDVKCFSCDSSSVPTRSFVSLANFPTSSYVRDHVALRHDVLKVEDSREETSTDVVSRLDTNEVESVRVTASENVPHEVDSHPDSSRKVQEEFKDRIKEVPARHDQSKLAESDFVSTTTNTADKLVPEDKNVDSPVQIVEFSTEANQNSELSGKKEDAGSTVAEDNLNVDSFGQIVETKENSEVRKDNLQVENRHLTSDDHTGHSENLVAPIEVNMSVTEVVPEPRVGQSPPQPVKVEVMRFGHENMTKELIVAAMAVQKAMDSITRSGLPKESANLPSDEGVDVNLLLRGGSPQGVPILESEKSCEGRHVFVYDLPSKFNADLVGKCDTLLRWFNFCDYFMNEGMGTNVPTDDLNDKGEKVLVPDGSWFLTHQYALELIFHARLKHYPCLTTDVNRANLFFVPYYAGLDVIRWHFQQNVTNDQRDQLTFELMSWLEGQETWSRNNGIDHVFVLGKIGWDFRRASDSAHWGSKLLRIPAMSAPTKVLIERDPWHNHDVGVPHPTFFHPKDDSEIRTWLAHVEQSERRYLVSFAGMPRPNMLGNVRGHLIQQCLDHPDDCFLLRCVKSVCLRPDSTMNLFLHSHFCMQPPGDSPTRRSVFDSLVGGCIPVIFDPYTVYYQYPWHLPQNASSYSVFIPSPDVMSGKSDIVKILKSITPEERTTMRLRIIREIIPGLLYSQPGTKHSDFRDAFDISIEALLHRVANLRAKKQ